MLSTLFSRGSTLHHSPAVLQISGWITFLWFFGASNSSLFFNLIISSSTLDSLVSSSTLHSLFLFLMHLLSCFFFLYLVRYKLCSLTKFYSFFLFFQLFFCLPLFSILIISHTRLFLQFYLQTLPLSFLYLFLLILFSLYVSKFLQLILTAIPRTSFFLSLPI